MAETRQSGVTMSAKWFARSLATALFTLAAASTLGCTASGGRTFSQCPASRSGLPASNRPHIAVLSGEMPGSIRDVSRHSWVVANVKGRNGAYRYRRYEWLGAAAATDSDNPFDYFGNGDVAVHGVIEDDAKIDAMVACLERETKAYHDANCGCWPGPNSNTFADGLIRTCGLGIELPATALGRDYRGPIGVSITEGRTGVQFETWPFGAKIGLKEGIGADLAGLSLGVHFWPPGIEVPVNPGRIGIDGSVHHAPNGIAPDDGPWPRRSEPPIPHEYGAASITMALAYAHAADSSRVGGLSDRATVGLEGRGVYGTTVGYAFGFDLGIGAAAPLGFAYDAHLLPLGIGLVLGNSGFVTATSGIGTSGVSSSVRGVLELPQELRVEVDLADVARLGLYGGFFVVPSTDDRRTIESVFGATTRLGTRASGSFERKRGSGGGSGGFFFGLERRELLRSFLLGATFGYEIGAGG